MKLNNFYYLIFISIFFFSCSKDVEKKSVLNEKNLNMQVLEAYEQGMEFQDWVVRQFNRIGFCIQLNSSKKYQFSEDGESVQRCEIKLDNRCTETGRLSIEIAEKTRDDANRPWVPSGIYAKNSTVFYIQGNHEILFLFDLKFLRRYWEFHKKNGVSPEESHGTVRKFYLSIDDAQKYCIVYVAGLPGH